MTIFDGLMIIDLSAERKEYFRDYTAAQIVRQFCGEIKSFSVKRDLSQLDREHKLVIGTAEGSLDKLLDESYSLDSLSLVSKIEEAEPNQLIVLPLEYRIPSEEAREAVVYSRKTLINLDSVHVKRKILGSEAKSGRLSGKKKREHCWEPEKVLRAAINYLHENKEKVSEKVYSCYGWKDKNGRQRVVPLIRAIQGVELRMFQNLAAFKIIPPRADKEIKEGIKFKDKSELTLEQIERRKQKVEWYKQIVEHRGLGDHIRRLNVSGWDLIEPEGIPFNFRTGRYVRVPSLTRPQELMQGQKITRLCYLTTLLDLPLASSGDPTAYSRVWDLEGICECKDFRYRSHRRKNSPVKGTPDVLFCKHLVGASWDLKSIHKNDERGIPFLPFVLPTEAMESYLDKLRYQTIVLDKTEEGNWTKRGLNHTEIERLLWSRAISRGYEACFATDPQKLVKTGDDPLLYLVRFRN